MDVPAYADAQFAIEAEILPHVREPEGPFAVDTDVNLYDPIDVDWAVTPRASTRT